MNSQFNIIEWLKWFFEKYQSLQNKVEEQNLLKVLTIYHNKHGQCMARIQMVGKASIAELTPREIVADNKLLEGFSKKDIRTLTYYATQEIKEPKHKILSQEICEKSNKIKFKLCRNGILIPLEKTAEEISLDKNILNNLPPEDAHTVGYTTATEQMLREREEMKALKKPIEKI